MTIREELEEEESRFLSKYATLSRDSVGRERLESEDDLRPCFQRDRDRILHCKAFRRLKHKTQVFLAPEGDHYRTRLTHTLEVSQIARTIAKCLHLNETLTEAIALGHDLRSCGRTRSERPLPGRVQTQRTECANRRILRKARKGAQPDAGSARRYPKPRNAQHTAHL